MLFENVDRQQMDDRCLPYYKLIYEPSAQVSYKFEGMVKALNLNFQET